MALFGVRIQLNLSVESSYDYNQISKLNVLTVPFDIHGNMQCTFVKMEINAQPTQELNELDIVSCSSRWFNII